MDIFYHAATQMIILFLLLAVGFIARRLKIMSDSFDAALSRLVMSIALPAMILNSVLDATELPDTQTILTLLAFSCLSYILICAIAAVVPRLFRHLSASSQGAHSFIIAFGNVGFMGLPVLDAIFGPTAVLYGAICNIPFNLAIFTIGILFVARKDKPSKKSKLSKKKDSKKNKNACSGLETAASSTANIAANQTADAAINPTADANTVSDTSTAATADTTKTKDDNPIHTIVKNLVSPATLSCVAVVFLAVFHITDSGGIIQSTCSYLGQITVPASMLIIGSSLAVQPLKSVFGHLTPYISVAFRLICAPLIVNLAFRFILPDTFVLGVITVSCGMPVAAVGTMFCLLYNGDGETMARATFLSTVASIITIPILACFVS